MNKTALLVKPKEYLLFNAFLLFVIIHTIQVGVGLPGFQRIIVKEAGHDAWISVIIAGTFSHVVAWIMLKTLKHYGSTDLYGVHEEVYGKWIGKLISSIYILYLLTASIMILRNYIEMVQAWMFPEMPTWLLAILLLFLIGYGIMGGLRVVVGVCLLTLAVAIWLIFSLYYPLQYSEWHHLLPIMEASIPELVRGAYKMTFTVIGFEILYFIFPFVKDKAKAPLYTHLSLLFTTVIYFLVMVVSLGYFSDGQILKNIWATFTLFKIIKFPFLERFEYVAIAIWMFVILPNLLLYIWAATRGMKRIFQWKQKYALYPSFIIIFLAVINLKTRAQVNVVNDWFANQSFYLIFIYPFILYGLVKLRSLLKRKGKKQS